MVRLAIDLEEAEANLSALIHKLEDGTEIVITRHGQPLARLVSAAPSPRRDRVPGSARGLFTVPEDFDAPLEDFQEYT